MKSSILVDLFYFKIRINIQGRGGHLPSVNNPHFVVIIHKNIIEITHDIGEESDSHDHQTDTNDLLTVSLRTHVTVTYCRQCCEHEIAANDHPVEFTEAS